MRGIRLDVDSTTSVVSWTSETGLEALQDAVGGAVDCVGLSPTLCMCTNDEGMYLYPINPAATQVAHRFLGPTQAFHGPTVFTGGLDKDGSTQPIADGRIILIETVSAQFQDSPRDE